MRRILILHHVFAALLPTLSDSLPAGFRTDRLPPGDFLQTARYARASDHARSFNKPGGSSRDLGVGFVHVSIVGEVSVAGESWYRMSDSRYGRSSEFRLVNPSSFRGVVITENLRRPFGWVVRDTRAESGLSIPRYTFVEILESRQRSDGEWVRIGNGEWIGRADVRVVSSVAPPKKLGDHEKWFDVNLTEQTITAYVGLKPVYATLIASGLDEWPTRPGLFRVWRRAEREKMSGNPRTPLYYFNADVPYIMYFDRGVALHGAYWHDKFGNQVSHGCVNLPPQDAEWLYQWSRNAPGARVWVHKATTSEREVRNAPSG